MSSDIDRRAALIRIARLVGIPDASDLNLVVSAVEDIVVAADPEEFCPHCGVSWRGDVIPFEHRHLFGGRVYFNRKIGIEDPALFDGVIAWKCADCGSVFNHWPTVKR